MKLWKRIAICMILSLSIIFGGLIIKWKNKIQAELCPPGTCCLIDVATYTASSGTEITFVYTTCGTVTVFEYPDGSIFMSICTDNGCAFGSS